MTHTALRRHTLRTVVAIALHTLAAVTATAQCPIQNTAFSAGEDLQYQLYFNWKFIWLKAGTANLNISRTNYKGQQAYRCHLITRGSDRTDKYFMLRDTLLSYLTPDLVPLYYRKGAFEGKRYNVDEVHYSYADGQTHLDQRYINPKGEVRTRRHDSAECVFDMVSMLMRARSFDPTAFSEGQHIEFLMADGDDVARETLIYRGRKRFKMEDSNVTYRCLVFSFVEYEGKKEKDIVTFYVTDDANHMPVRLDLYLKFGTAKAYLSRATGLRNAQTSIVR